MDVVTGLPEPDPLGPVPMGPGTLPVPTGLFPEPEEPDGMGYGAGAGPDPEGIGADATLELPGPEAGKEPVHRGIDGLATGELTPVLRGTDGATTPVLYIGAVDVAPTAPLDVPLAPEIKLEDTMGVEV